MTLPDSGTMGQSGGPSMPSRRILIVDDSVVIRGALARALDSQPDIDVIGTARDGQVALDSVDSLRPDLVLLDIEMPNMDGLQFLDELKRRGSNVAVLVFSSSTQAGALSTIMALSRGASDYVSKPSQLAGAEVTMEQAQSALLEKIRGLANAKMVLPQRPGGDASVHSGISEPAAGPVRRPDRLRPVQVVAIGVSTGGPEALTRLLVTLPPDFPAPVLIVQHMPSAFTAQLAKSLDARCALRVSEAEDGEPAVAGHVYIAPGGFHLEVTSGPGQGAQLRVTSGPPVKSCRPSVDVLFQAVARVYGRNALGVVLTGMGDDGVDGSRAIVGAGGEVFAQDEASSVIWSMPGSVVAAGLASKIVALGALGARIRRRIQERMLPHGLDRQ